MIGKDFPCPECERLLAVRLDAARRPQVMEAVDPREELATRIHPQWSRSSRVPMAIASVAIVLAVGTLIWIINRGGSSLVTDVRPAKKEAEVPPPDPEPETEPKVVNEDDQPISVVVAEDVAVEGPPAPAIPAPEDLEESQPIDVPLAPDFPRIDIVAQLRQPILEFSQGTPVEVRQLLEQMEEMSAVPIDVSALDGSGLEERLNRQVSLVLKETTVGEILAAIVQQAELRLEVTDEAIIVHPSEPPQG